MKIFEATQSIPLKMAIASIPVVGGALDVLLTDGVRSLREEHEKEFFDELSIGSFEITDDLSRNHNFIHCFLITARAALRSHHREKIRMFAKVLKKSMGQDGLENIDEFEEIVSIIDNISFREWSAVVIISEMAGDYAGAKIRISKELSVPIDEIDGFLGRIERSGLLQRGGLAWGGSGAPSEIAPMFYRVRKLVTDN